MVVGRLGSAAGLIDAGVDGAASAQARRRRTVAKSPLLPPPLYRVPYSHLGKPVVQMVVRVKSHCGVFVWCGSSPASDWQGVLRGFGPMNKECEVQCVYCLFHVDRKDRTRRCSLTQVEAGKALLASEHIFKSQPVLHSYLVLTAIARTRCCCRCPADRSPSTPMWTDLQR